MTPSSVDPLLGCAKRDLEDRNLSEDCRRRLDRVIASCEHLTGAADGVGSQRRYALPCWALAVTYLTLAYLDSKALRETSRESGLPGRARIDLLLGSVLIAAHLIAIFPTLQALCGGYGPRLQAASSLLLWSAGWAIPVWATLAGRCLFLAYGGTSLSGGSPSTEC